MDVATRAAVLQALRQPAFGQEIVLELAARSNGRVRLHFGSVYPTLRRLEREQLVRSWTQHVGRGRPRRNYELTIAGIVEAQRVREGLRSLIDVPLTTYRRTPRQMARSIRDAESISLLARAVRQRGQGS